ncbi:MAG: thiamine pyrophosphokinase [Granulosicoccus sp.]|jgi:thiamine pyrophosphokinase
MKNNRRAWVFAGGDFVVDHLPMHKVQEQDLVVCVDRGLEHCLQIGLHPDMLIGDLDSVPQSLLQDDRIADVKRYIFPSEKAASDLELALTILSEGGVDEVILLGVSGGRSDHMLFNWQLVRLRQWPFSIQFIDDTTHTYVLEGAHDIVIESAIGSFLSLLAMERSMGVSTAGLQYPLSNAVIEAGSTLGLSNVVVSQPVRVEISSGTLLVIVQRTKKSIH